MHSAPRATISHATRPGPTPTARLGVTLTELIVGIVLLTVGIGALAGTAAAVLHETAASRRAERATILARTRLEHLRLGTCASSTGLGTTRGFTERWSVVASDGAATATVSIAYHERGRDVTQHYATRFGC